MPEDVERTTITTDVPPGPIRTVRRRGLGIGILLVVGALTSPWSGAGPVLPGTEIAIGSLFVAATAAAVVAGFLFAAPAVEAVVVAALDGPACVVRDLGAAARYAVVYVAALIGYAAFAPVVLPVLPPDGAWLYHLAFHGFGLLVAVAVGRRFLPNVDAVAGELARVFAGPTPAGPGEPEQNRARGS